MFSLVIPCYVTHVRNIKRAITFFLKEHNSAYKTTNGRLILLSEIIIIFNGIKFAKQPGKMKCTIESTMKSIQSDINFIESSEKIKLNYDVVEDQMNPGSARERATDKITSDYVVFHDADDRPHPQKLSILRDIFMKTESDHVHHLVLPLGLNFKEYKQNESFSFDIPFFKVDNEMYREQQSVVLSKKSIGPVTHGLLAIKTEKLRNMKWSNLRTGEDRRFVLDSIINNNVIFIVQAFLSVYNKYKIVHFKRGFPELYDQYIAK